MRDFVPGLGAVGLVWVPLVLVARVAAGAEAGTDTGPRVVAVAPLKYFQENCARCHGDEGAFYARPVAGDRTDAELLRVLEEMAQGPGNAPLGPEDLEVQRILHRSWGAGAPFAAVTSWQAPILEGEASEGAAVSLLLDGKAVPVQREGASWRAELKGAVDWKGAVLEVRQNGRSAQLGLSERAVVPTPPAGR